jgi:hypothetical protein
VPAGVADTRFIEQPVYMAIAGAGAAVFQFRERRDDAGGEFPLAIGREIGRLKVADEESGFHVPTGANHIGSVHNRNLMLLQPPGRVRRERAIAKRIPPVQPFDQTALTIVLRRLFRRQRMGFRVFCRPVKSYT